MRLVDVYAEPRAAGILYDLLAERERENWISHEKMPTMEEHVAFIAARAFRLWLLIHEDDYVGAIEVTDKNEIGVHIFKRYQRRGHAARAIDMFLAHYAPLPPIPAIRNGHWLANVAVGNVASKAFFASQRFVPLQTTFVLESSDA